jgi:sensor domain CHASE-containing protein
MSNNFKKSVLIALTALLLAVVATLAVQHFNQYQKKETAKKQAIVAAEASEDKELASLKVRVTDLVAKYNEQRIACEKGSAAYALLAPAVKAKAAQPTCGPVITK